MAGKSNTRLASPSWVWILMFLANSALNIFYVLCWGIIIMSNAIYFLTWGKKKIGSCLNLFSQIIVNEPFQPVFWSFQIFCLACVMRSGLMHIFLSFIYQPFKIQVFSIQISGMCNQGFVFCEKVKERLCSSDDYQAFLKCLNIYSNRIIKRNDLQNLVCFTPSLAVIFDFSNHAIYISL